MHIRLHNLAITLTALSAPISAVKTPFNASFDDVPGSAVATLAPLGIYKNIFYSGFDVAQPGIDGESANGVMVHSKPNFVVTPGASSLSIVYPGSKIKSFGLSSFYYGCDTALKQSEADIAVACNVNVTGYKAGSTKPAATQTFEFTPAEPVDLMNPPTFGTFSSAFQGLEYANITFTPPTLVALVMDNIVGFTES